MVSKINLNRFASAIFKKTGSALVIMFIFLVIGHSIFAIKGLYFEILKMNIISIVLVGIFYSLNIQKLNDVDGNIEDIKAKTLWNHIIPAYVCILASLLLSVYLAGMPEYDFRDKLLIPEGALAFSYLLVVILDSGYYLFRKHDQ